MIQKFKQNTIYKGISPGIRKKIDANTVQILMKGFYFNIPVGTSNQNIQIPGNASEIIGFMASYDVATNPGFNVSTEVSLNNESIYDAIDLQAFSVMRNILPFGWLPVSKMVKGTDILNVDFNNLSALAVLNCNFIIVYK